MIFLAHSIDLDDPYNIAKGIRLRRLGQVESSYGHVGFGNFVLCLFEMSQTPLAISYFSFGQTPNRLILLVNL